MENLMNKIALDLKNFAPEAPVGMEERIQTALSKKKSFWAFSWYTMNVYLVALVGAGLLALVFANRDSNVIAQVSTTVATEEKSTTPSVDNMNVNSNVVLNVEKENTTASVKTSRRSKVVQKESTTSVLVVENCQSATAVEPVVTEVAENIEVQKLPEEVQATKTVNEVVKPKGRSLRLTRLTGK
jgi:cytoskeletal protein RodZ